MGVPLGVKKTNNTLFVTVHLKTHVNWNFLIIYGCHFLINKPQSDVVLFAIIIIQLYKNLVTKCKHGTGPNDIIIFNEVS